MKKNLQIPPDLIPFFRTNHAGETGAVYIYKAILYVSKNKEIVNFATNHLKTESEHLKLIENILEKKHRSKLIFLWKIAGFVTGLIPSLFSKKFVFATIFYVESFVEKHYQEQIDMLGSKSKNNELKKFLKKLQEDEISHKDDAILEVSKFSYFHKIWGQIVGMGSAFAVKISMYI